MCDILFLDDQKIEIDILVKQLQKLSNIYINDIEIVTSKENFYKIIKEKSFKLILADYKIEIGFTAENVLEYINSKNLDIPIIIVTGAIGEEKAAELMRLGASDLVLKTNPEKLNEVINREMKNIIHKIDQYQIIKQTNTILFKLAKLVNWVMQNSLNDIDFNRIIVDFNRLLKTDRGYIFQKIDDEYKLKYMTCNFINCNNQDCDQRCIKFDNSIFDKISNYEIIQGTISNLSSEERNIFSDNQIKSYIMFPILNPNKKIWGFVGFDMCQFEVQWTQTEINSLELLAAVLGTIIYKISIKEKEDEIINQQIQLMRTARESIMEYLNEGEMRHGYE